MIYAYYLTLKVIWRNFIIKIFFYRGGRPVSPLPIYAPICSSNFHQLFQNCSLQFLKLRTFWPASLKRFNSYFWSMFRCWILANSRLSFCSWVVAESSCSLSESFSFLAAEFRCFRITFVSLARFWSRWPISFMEKCNLLKIFLIKINQTLWLIGFGIE